VFGGETYWKEKIDVDPGQIGREDGRLMKLAQDSVTGFGIRGVEP
jgi:hypothetical protein